MVEVIVFPEKKPTKYTTLDATNWHMTRSYCATSRVDQFSPCGVRVADHLFSDQPVGVDLDLTVSIVQRKPRAGDTELDWKRGYYGKSAAWITPPPDLEVANATRKKCLGIYAPTGKFNNYDKYTNKHGACMFYWLGWKLSESGKTDEHVFETKVRTDLPPLGLWSTDDGSQSCDVFQAPPQARSAELHARRMHAQQHCQSSKPSTEMTFSERVAIKTRVIERQAQKKRRVRKTMKSKQVSSSSDCGDTSDCDSSLSSDSSASGRGDVLQDMVAAMAPIGAQAV